MTNFRSELTVEVPDKSCSYCGEDVPVRVIDYGGYLQNELICEECFAHEIMCWDDLDWPKWPREE